MQHYPPAPAGRAGAPAACPQHRGAGVPAIGPAAERWLIKAAAAGTQRVRRKIAEAVDLAKLHGADEVNRALETCARRGPVRRR